MRPKVSSVRRKAIVFICVSNYGRLAGSKRLYSYSSCGSAPQITRRKMSEALCFTLGADISSNAAITVSIATFTYTTTRYSTRDISLQDNWQCAMVYYSYGLYATNTFGGLYTLSPAMVTPTTNDTISFTHDMETIKESTITGNASYVSCGASHVQNATYIGHPTGKIYYC